MISIFSLMQAEQHKRTLLVWRELIHVDSTRETSHSIEANP